MMEYRLESSLRILRWHAMELIKTSTEIMGIRHIQKADNTESCEMSWIVLLQWKQKISQNAWPLQKNHGTACAGLEISKT